MALDEVGRREAEALAEVASERGFVALYSSPLLRARQTADVVAARLGLSVRDDTRLIETDTGRWTDRSFADIEAQQPEALAAYLAADPTFRFPGGESYEEQTTRVIAAVAEIGEGPLPAPVISHRGAIRLALAHFRGDQSLRFADVPTGTLVPLTRPAD